MLRIKKKMVGEQRWKRGRILSTIFTTNTSSGAEKKQLPTEEAVGQETISENIQGTVNTRRWKKLSKRLRRPENVVKSGSSENIEEDWQKEDR